MSRLPVMIYDLTPWQYTYMFIVNRPLDAQHLKFPDTIAAFRNLRASFLLQWPSNDPPSPEFHGNDCDVHCVMFDIYETYMAKKMAQAIRAADVVPT